MSQAMTDSTLPTGAGKLSSVSGFAMLLDDDSVELREYALRELNTVVDGHWYEMAEHLSSVESCFEDEMFPSREQAALLASKIYFHMEDYDEALKYLLSSYRLFDPLENSSFAESMVVKCVDEFIKVCKAHFDSVLAGKKDSSPTGMDVDDSLRSGATVHVDGLDSRLEEIVLDLISRSTSSGRVLSALGIVLEARRSDLLVNILNQNLDRIQESGLAQFCDQCLGLIHHLDSRSFRSKSYRILVTLIEEKVKCIKESPSLRAYCECLCKIEEGEKLGLVLTNLAEDSTNFPKAYSIAFMARECENVLLLKDIIGRIDLYMLGIGKTTTPVDTSESGEIKDELAKSVKTEDGGDKMSESKDSEGAGRPDPPVPSIGERLAKVKSILSGEIVSELNLRFLHLNNQPDLGALEHIKNNCDQRSAISHTAMIISHGLMQAGTTCDVFLRSNLDWVGKANHWSRFSTASSLGVIHMGHIKEAFKVLSTCLPNSNGGSSSSGGVVGGHGHGGGAIGTGNALGGQYSEGGAFFALGLINTSHIDPEAKEYLLDKLKNPQRNEVLQHGASLGLGVMGFGSCDQELYEELRNVLYMDNAVAGEAAAYGIGLVMFGSGSKKAIGDLLSYARDTQHEKIVRACSVSLGLVMFSHGGEETDELFKQLNSDGEHFIRYGAMHVLGLAYCGTGNEFAMEKLLHASVSELSDDNRRAAIFALGLVMCRNRQQVPQVFSLLCDSYNPHVRYAAALTLGMTYCGVESPKVMAILKSMTSDSADIVRQAAYIGLGFLLMQQNEYSNDKFACTRNQIIKAAIDKHEHIATRFGAILSLGIMDGGGRNVIASLFSRNGESLRPQSVAGLCLFFQFWFWFPLINFVSLAYVPTCLVGLDDQLRVPKGFNMLCNSSKASFDFPKSFSQDKNEDKKVVVTAVLSTASKRRPRRKIVAAGTNYMSGPSSPTSVLKQEIEMSRSEDESCCKISEDSYIDSEMKIDDEDYSSDAVKKSNEKEETNSFVLNNPFRVLKNQEQFLEFIPNSRYSPILLPPHNSGFVVLRDNTPSEKEEYLFTVGQDSTKKEVADDGKETKPTGDEKMFGNDDNKDNSEEMVPPETFEWQG